MNFRTISMDSLEDYISIFNVRIALNPCQNLLAYLLLPPHPLVYGLYTIMDGL